MDEAATVDLYFIANNFLQHVVGKFKKCLYKFLVVA